MSVGLRRAGGIAEHRRQEGIGQNQYYSSSKVLLEAAKKRLAGDTTREANTGEVKNLRKETRDLKKVVGEQAPELHLLTKSMYEDGDNQKRGIHQKRSLKSSNWLSSHICQPSKDWTS